MAATAQCNALERANFSRIQDAPTQIIRAKVVEAKGKDPAYCQVGGYVEPQVGFELLLPIANWNGKFFEVGCGGACGNLESTLWCPIDRGYACVVADMGHKGKGQDGLWAVNNLQAQVDFGYRGPHVAALAGKAITEHYYGKAPKYSYFWGCSTGGRQALVEAERFPWDFDGIIGGAPWIDDSDSTMNYVWAYRALKGADGKLVVSRADLQLVHDAALAKCDMDDGVKDGVISNPPACTFDPSELVCKAGQTVGCLTQIQANSVRKVYDGPRNSKGERIFTRGAEPGSELAWLESYTGWDDVYGHREGGDEEWALEYFRYMVIPPAGPCWQLTDYDFDRDYKRFGTGVQESLLSAANPDLRKFKAAGGKLIVYQGWADPEVPPEKTIDFYQTVQRTMGGRAPTKSFFRLFMVPGMKHCSSGDGAFAIDYVSYMEAWVEHGQAPDMMIGAHVLGVAVGLKFPLDPSTPISFTRPIFPYPLWAKYKGTGDPNNSANFFPSATTLSY
jgi:feruloyl esterase